MIAGVGGLAAMALGYRAWDRALSAGCEGSGVRRGGRMAGSAVEVTGDCSAQRCWPPVRTIRSLGDSRSPRRQLRLRRPSCLLSGLVLDPFRREMHLGSGNLLIRKFCAGCAGVRDRYRCSICCKGPVGVVLSHASCVRRTHCSRTGQAVLRPALRRDSQTAHTPRSLPRSVDCAGALAPACRSRLEPDASRGVSHRRRGSPRDWRAHRRSHRTDRCRSRHVAGQLPVDTHRQAGTSWRSATA